MNWEELLEVINHRAIEQPATLQEDVDVYDGETGDNFPADTMEFLETETNEPKIFLSIKLD
jgi:hypothetical protein|tara:strand:- start:894 stop:1076 length:183 start_codon:yes stop_codon:yes gene_type:complete